MEKRSEISHRTISPARVAAFDILLRVERESSYASELLHSRTYTRLSTSDHALATELVMGVLRWRSRLDSEISQASTQPLTKLDLEVLTALRLALYQLRRLTRIPDRAAIHESVELVKRARKNSAASFVNAVLRSLAGAVESYGQSSNSIPSAKVIAAASAHPLWLVERWTKAYGIDVTLQICQYDQSVPVRAVRLRHREAEQSLQTDGIELAPGAILAYSRRVVSGDITRTSAFRRGLFVIQDEASQLVAALFGDGRRILDCCAAPGGKTSAIADANPESEIVAAELYPHRAQLLRKLLSVADSAAASQHARISVITADARSLPFTTKFDRILADVPCSGTGTLSRNPEIKWRLKPEDITDLQARQLAILRSAMSLASPGGRVIYSTCSLEEEENEDVIERVLLEDSSFQVVDCGGELDRLRRHGHLIWRGHSLTRGLYLRTLPGAHPCDGFFAAILEKS